NIPLLLQVFFWYFAVLAALPHARNSINIGESIFLNVRGLYIPSLHEESGAWMVYLAIIVAIVGIYLLRKWARKRQDETGQQFPVWPVSIAIILFLPLMVNFILGSPFYLEYPKLGRFNISGGTAVIPELMALAISLSIYTGAFIAEAVRAGVQSVPHGQTEAARSLGLSERKIMSLIIVPQAMRVIVPLLNSEYQ
ncbi:MAG: amino acid ABC transporter permease, partial [Phototrophicales bacterium]